MLLVILHNRTAERRGRQNAWVWQTWRSYYLRVLSGIHITLMFFALNSSKRSVYRNVKFSGRFSQTKFIIVTLVTQGLLPSLLSRPIVQVRYCYSWLLITGSRWRHDSAGWKWNAYRHTRKRGFKSWHPGLIAWLPITVLNMEHHREKGHILWSP